MPVKRKNAPEKGKVVTIMEAESIFGLTALTIRRWIGQGMPAEKRGSVWSINTARMFAFVRAMDQSKQTGPANDTEARLANAKVMKAELEAAEAASLVIPIPLVEEAMGEVMSAARTRLMGIAPAVAVECAAAETATECREIIAGQVERVCEDIANALQAISRR